MLSHRERILSVFQNQPTDRVPYFPDLFYWYRVRKNEGRIPPKFRGMKLYDIYRELECGICRHVYGDFVKVSHGDTEITVETEGRLKITTVRNRAGEVREVRTTTADSLESYFPIEHFVKTLDDLDVLEAMILDEALEPRPEAVVKIGKDIGEQGIYTLVQRASPLRKVVTDWVGLEGGLLMLFDHPERIRKTFEIIEHGEDEYTRITCETPGRIVIMGDNVDRSLLPPPLFREYQIPYYRKRAAQFHAAGKIVMLHQDGQLQGLLPLMKDTGIDVMDGLTPEPAGDFTVDEVRDAMSSHLKCWCGVPASLYCDETPVETLRDMNRRIISTLGGRLVLNVADQVPPNAHIDKVADTAQLAIEAGAMQPW